MFTLFAIIIVTAGILLNFYERARLNDYYRCVLAEKRITLLIQNPTDKPLSLINVFSNVHEQLIIKSETFVTYKILKKLFYLFSFSIEKIYMTQLPMEYNRTAPSYQLYHKYHNWLSQWTAQPKSLLTQEGRRDVIFRPNKPEDLVVKRNEDLVLDMIEANTSLRLEFFLN